MRVRGSDGRWAYKIKLSEQVAKISIPGIQQVRRFHTGNEFVGDAIFDVETGVPSAPVIVDFLDATRRKKMNARTSFEDLLVPVFRRGKPVYQSPPLSAIRQRTQDQLARFHSGVKRFAHPHPYPVGLELGLHQLRTQLLMQARRHD